jgi:phage baseplate assembly protein W
MSGNFLGKGWGFPIGDGENLNVALHEQSIQQGIRIILGTSPGERVMRPDFGCGIHELVFSLRNSTTAGMMVQRIRDALHKWEPRIDLLDVRVLSVPNEPSTVLIHIEYRVRTTNNRFNLVYPFYLQQITQ